MVQKHVCSNGKELIELPRRNGIREYTFIRSFIRLFRNRSDDGSEASSKASSPHSAV